MSEGTAIQVLQHMQLEDVQDDKHDLDSVKYGFELARQIALGAIRGNATPPEQPATDDAPEAGAHTPGPWRVSYGDGSGFDCVTTVKEIDELPTHIVEVPEWRQFDGGLSPQQEANLALIARAPDLLARNTRLRADLAAEEKRVELVRERRDYWHSIAEKWNRKYLRVKTAHDARRAEKGVG